MRIKDIRFQKERFSLEQPFRVAFGSISELESVLIKVETEEGLCGYGEAATLPYVTGDNMDTALSVGKELRSALIGKDPTAVEALHAAMDPLYNGNTAIKAGIDIACYDICAKNAGIPLYRHLGGDNSALQSDVTIGIDSPEEMAKQAEEWVRNGFSILKVKLGQDVDMDRQRIEAVREATGCDVRIRVDANQGWSVKESLRIIPRLAALGVELVEQPVAACDIDGLKEIRDRSDLLIAADESCHSEYDAFRLAAMRAVDMINIKLMKCGGIFHAQRIAAICEAAGISCMIGCMGESNLANVAAMHVAAATGNIKEVDLDTVYLLKQDKVSGGFTHAGGTVQLTENPGIGCTLKEVF